VLVGDAAGYFDPFTGQGIYRALRSAELACEAVDTTLRSPSAGWRELRSYGRTLAVELRGGRWLQRVVEVIMARPRLRGPVVDLLARGGALDDVIRVTGDAAPVSSLLRPGLWTGLLASRGEAPC
jgi:flavin-dependent dehydrogenase